MNNNPQSVRDLLSDTDLAVIWDAPVIDHLRHPTWYPVFKATDESNHLTNRSVRMIADAKDGADWLKQISPRLADPNNREDAAAGLAEVRAYGALLEAGFSVEPVPTAKTPTPDFRVRIDGKTVVVEVFAKHQDDKQRDLSASSASEEEPIDEPSNNVRAAQVRISEIERHPGGAPDPDKQNDSIQANLISKLCGIKSRERQFGLNDPSLLWVDMRAFGPWPQVMSLGAC